MLALWVQLAVGVLGYDVQSWSRSQLQEALARGIGPEDKVVEAAGQAVHSAPPLTGLVYGRYQAGAYTYGRVATVFTRGGKEWVSGGTGLGGAVELRLEGVLDLAGTGKLDLTPGWEEPAKPAKRPTLVVYERTESDDGSSRGDLVLLSLSDPEQPAQVGRLNAGWRVPYHGAGWEPNMPPQRIIGGTPVSLAVEQGQDGPVLVYVEQPEDSPDNGCLRPEPETHRYVWTSGYLTEQTSANLPGCH